jgi:hypothetical protein
MAGDWIKMRGNLWDDPRVAAICDATGSTEGPVIGALYWLWATADQHTEDGCMPGLTLGQIDRKTGLRGFAAALVAIGWLDDDPQGVVIRNFEEHNGASAKKRASTAKRVANHRACNADETQDDEPCNAASVTGALAREEKRREEEIPSVAKATDVPSPPKAKSPEDQAKADLWQAAVAVLKAGGCESEPLARSFMGKLVKDYGMEPVRSAVASAATAQPADAREYLKATCQRLKGERRDPITVPSNAAAKTAEYLAEFERAKVASQTPEARAAKEAALSRLLGPSRGLAGAPSG